MEILVVALAELIVLLVHAGLLLICEILAPLIALLVEFVVLAFTSRRQVPIEPAVTSEPSPGSKPPEAQSISPAPAQRPAVGQTPLQARWRKVLRWMTIISAGLFAFTILVLIVLNFFFFNATVRYAVNTAEQNSGIRVDFESADGNLFTGRVRLKNASLKRAGHATSDFDLTADETFVDVSIPSLVTGDPVFEEIQISKLRGQIDRIAVADSVKPRKNFVVSKLMLLDSEIQFVDHTRQKGPFKATVGVNSFESENIRGDWALFDVLFHSNGSGTIDGRPFAVKSASSNGKTTVNWRAEALPVAMLAPFVGGGMAWVKDGTTDVDVTNSYSESDTEIHLQWNLNFRALKVATPEDWSSLKRKLFSPAMDYLNSMGPNLPLNFDIVLKRDAFRYGASPESVGLWNVLTDSISRTFMEYVSEKFPSVKKLK